MHGEGWTHDNCKSLAGARKGVGRFIRIGEVTDALGGHKGQRKPRLEKMRISMPKATTNRTIGERELMARGERAVRPARRGDEEPGAAPGVGEGNEKEGGDAAVQCLDDGGDAYNGRFVAETRGVCDFGE
jgi:hypothetical protein